MYRLIILAVIAASLTACAMSQSSESSASSSASSKSIGKLLTSPSTSSSGNSKESKQQTFSRDVAEYTAEFAQYPRANLDSFRAKISKLAADNGVSHWEEDKTTYVAIGKGLRQARLQPAQYESFKTRLSEAVEWKMQAIEAGYR